MWLKLFNISSRLQEHRLLHQCSDIYYKTLQESSASCKIVYRHIYYKGLALTKDKLGFGSRFTFLFVELFLIFLLLASYNGCVDLRKRWIFIIAGQQDFLVKRFLPLIVTICPFFLDTSSFWDLKMCSGVKPLNHQDVWNSAFAFYSHHLFIGPFAPCQHPVPSVPSFFSKSLIWSACFYSIAICTI